MHQYCHLLSIYYIGWITFHSILVYKASHFHTTILAAKVHISVALSSLCIAASWRCMSLILHSQAISIWELSSLMLSQALNVPSKHHWMISYLLSSSFQNSQSCEATTQLSGYGNFSPLIWFAVIFKSVSQIGRLTKPSWLASGQVAPCSVYYKLCASDYIMPENWDSQMVKESGAVF